MASKQEPTITLKYWVNEGKNSVVVAEASGEFVDVLFSFLTLPLGTITRLVKKDQSLEIGCINNLYNSVKDLTPNVFWNNICQKMLLSPRNPLEASCQRLKVKVDDTEPTRYYVCGSCPKEGDLWVSAFAGAICCNCGKPMGKEVMLFVEPKDEVARGKGVFVQGDSMFMIFDDLEVIQSSPGNTVQRLLKLGHEDFKKLKQESRNVGTKEIFSILKKALASKTPLSDVLLRNRESNSVDSSFSPMYSSFSPNYCLSHHRCTVKLKLTVSKPENKILFAEADGAFMDFLFSFLTTPLGSILNLMHGKLSLGSIDNLYKSVKKLNSSWFIGSSNNSLLNPSVAPQFGCKSQPMNVLEQDTPSYWFGSKSMKGNIKREVISKNKDVIQDAKALKLFDPRSDGARGHAVGFMKRPCLFVVGDDLRVTPMTTTSSIEFVQNLGVPLEDFEEYVVEIKNSSEALNLLGAALTSKDALTMSFFCKVKTRKCIKSIWVCTGRKKDHGEKERKEKKKEDEVERKETEGEKNEPVITP